MIRSPTRARGWSAGIGTPLAWTAASALALVAALPGDRRLAADGPPSDDADLDFLVDAQERVLGTSPILADTDGDGYSDLEELARGSSPLSASSVPAQPSPVHVGLTAHPGTDGMIHVLVALYSSDLTLRDTALHLGMQARRTLIPLSHEWVAAHSTFQITTTADGHGLISLLDLSISPATFQSLGQFSIYATASIVGSGVVQSAGSARFLCIGGVPVLQMAVPRPTSSQSGPASSGRTSIYVPLPVSGAGIPSSWSAGEVCFQRSSPVGVNGPIITEEVVDANCLTGWDAYCPPTCTATVGSTYTSVDPVGLIGG
jgi:hypothetical protein